MRQSFLAPNSKEYILDVTRSFAYEVHRQPKRIIHTEPKAALLSLSKKLKGALSRMISSI